MKCHQITQNGKKCQRICKSKYCWQHGKGKGKSKSKKKSKSTSSSAKKKIFKDDLYEYQWQEPKYEINIIHPLVEIKRGMIINEIRTNFRKTVYDYIPKRLVQGKHPADKVLDIMLSRFILSQLIDDTKNKDPFIPTLILSYQGLEEDLRNLFRKDLETYHNQTVINKTIKKIIKKLNLEKAFQQGIKELKKYTKSDHFKKHRSNNKILRQDNNDQYKLSFIYQDNYYNLYITKESYHRVLARYISSSSSTSHDLILWCLIKRYQDLHSYNNQLAVHPEILQKLKECYQIGFELFGSVFNTYHNQYCSTFYDLEKYFGSRGSYFSFTPIKGFYTMNPPFDETIMTEATKRLLKNLDKSKSNLSVILWLPVWDKAGLEYVNQNCPGSYMKTYYSEFEAMKLLKNSPFFDYHQVVCLKDLNYYDYNSLKTKNVSNTNIVVIQNQNNEKDNDKFDSKCLEDSLLF